MPWNETVIYEAHVKGLTAQHPEAPPELRGTYAGLACPPVLEHLRRLGITGVELMLVHHFIDDKFLLDKGLRNYWGYNSIDSLLPDSGWSTLGAGARAAGDGQDGPEPHRPAQRLACFLLVAGWSRASSRRLT